MNKSLLNTLFLCLTALCGLMTPGLSFGLMPEEVVVIANKDAWYSVDLAKYYMKKRNIPSENLVKVGASDSEVCSREDYVKQVADPVRNFLKKNDPKEEKFRCFVTLFGVPLKVLSPKLTMEEERELVNLKKQYDSVSEKIKTTNGEKELQLLRSLREEQEQINRQLDKVRKVFQGAAVDSELALVREDSYPLDGWLPNRFFLGYRGKNIENMPQKAMMVSRLDGPSKEVIRRIIDDSLQVEKEGLQGKAYFDARWPDPGDKEVKDYAFYDRAIHRTAKLLETNNRLPVTIDSQEKLFQSGDCPDAECSTLRNSGSQVWCRMMLEKGVAATIGPVAEPYVQAFPIPDIFFGCLLEGQLTLAECYAISNPYWSWQMVLVGDPLYRPFKNRTKD